MSILKNKTCSFKKKIVICDRFIDSTIAIKFMEKVDRNYDNTKKILQGVKPNIVFVLKVSEKSSRARLKKERLKIDMIILQNHFTLKLKIFY